MSTAGSRLRVPLSHDQFPDNVLPVDLANLNLVARLLKLVRLVISVSLLPIATILFHAFPIEVVLLSPVVFGSWFAYIGSRSVLCAVYGSFTALTFGNLSGFCLYATTLLILISTQAGHPFGFKASMFITTAYFLFAVICCLCGHVSAFYYTRPKLRRHGHRIKKHLNYCENERTAS